MLCLPLVFFGTIILIYSELFYFRLNLKLKEHTSEEPCSTILILIGFFIFGYIVFFIYLIKNISFVSPNDLLVSIIFFFGSIFVITSLKTNNNLIFRLKEIYSSYEKQNINLKKLNKEEEIAFSETYKSKKEYQKKCDQLQEKIEELEKFQKLTVNRELKMIELKEKLKKLSNKK